MGMILLIQKIKINVVIDILLDIIKINQVPQIKIRKKHQVKNLKKKRYYNTEPWFSRPAAR
jgi:hypothetical protein